MCFFLLRFPRCRIHSLSNFWCKDSHNLCKNNGERSSYRVLCSTNYETEGGYSRKLIKQSIHSKTERNDETLSRNISIRNEIISDMKVQKSKNRSIGNNTLSESTKTGINTDSVETTDIDPDQHYADLAKLATIICFDIETTGFSREKDRIIEFACQDLRGGENSTLQTLVNPERFVHNEQIHGISYRMVNRRDVPRMKDFIPVLIQYIKSRQQPGGVVVLVSHNAKGFDVPFLKNEFSRCDYEIPPDWLFADTLPLAKVVMAKGSKRASLQTLREHYNIPLMGSAHRALSDVHSLALVLQRLTFDLKIPISGLIKTAFTL